MDAHSGEARARRASEALPAQSRLDARRHSTPDTGNARRDSDGRAAQGAPRRLEAPRRLGPPQGHQGQGPGGRAERVSEKEAAALRLRPRPSGFTKAPARCRTSPLPLRPPCRPLCCDPAAPAPQTSTRLGCGGPGPAGPRQLCCPLFMAGRGLATLARPAPLPAIPLIHIVGYGQTPPALLTRSTRSGSSIPPTTALAESLRVSLGPRFDSESVALCECG